MFLLFPVLVGCTNAISAKLSGASADVVVSAKNERTHVIEVELNRALDGQKAAEPGAENSGNNPDVVIPVTFSGESIKDTDYTVSDNKFVIPYGQTKGRITITIVDDQMNGPDERIILSLGKVNVDKVKWIGPAVYTILLQDDFPEPAVDFTVASQSLDQACGTATITAVLSGKSEWEVRVPFTLSGSAVNPTNHDLVAGEFVFAPETTTSSKTFNVFDEEFNYDRTLVVTIGTPSHAVRGSVYSQSILLVNNKPRPIVNLTSSSQTVAETVGTATLTLTQDRISLLDTIISYTVSGTSTNPGNHNLSSGNISLPAGQLSTDFTFNIVNDGRYDISKTAIITLQSVSGGSLGTVTTHTVTITNVNPPPTITFTTTGQTVTEPVAPTLRPTTVTATLDTLSNLNATVVFFLTGDYHNGQQDLSTLSITIPAGSLTTDLNFNIRDDEVDEPTRSFVLNMDGTTNATVGVNSVHTITILDSNVPSVASFSSPTSTISQSFGPVTISLPINESGYAITVPFTVSGTAVQGVDHDLVDGNFTLAAGGVVATKTFNIIGDSNLGTNKTIIVTLGAPTNATLGANSVLTLTLSDPVPVAYFWNASEDVAEPPVSTTTNVPIRLTSRMALAAIVPFTLSGTASSPLDYTVSAAQVNIAAGALSGGVTVTINNDNLSAGDKTIIFTMGAPTNATGGMQDTETINILDGAYFANLPSLELSLNSERGVKRDFAGHVVEWRDASRYQRHLSENRCWAQPKYDTGQIRFYGSHHQLTAPAPLGDAPLTWFTVRDKNERHGPILEIDFAKDHIEKLIPKEDLPASVHKKIGKCVNSLHSKSLMKGSFFDLPLLREVGVLKPNKKGVDKGGIKQLSAYNTKLPTKDVLGLMRFLIAKYQISDMTCSSEDAE